MRITLRQLAIFRSVHECGATTQAAESLNLAQSAVSSGLKHLEAHLGASLFDRGSRGLIRNSAGRQFYPVACALLEQAERVAQHFQHYLPPLHIAASSTIGNYLLPSVIARHARKQPEQRIQLTVGNTQDVITMVAEYTCDLGFIEGPCQHPTVQCRFWQEDTLIWFAKRDSRHLPRSAHKHIRITEESFSKIPLIVREPGSGTRQAVAKYAPDGHIAFEFGSSEAIKQAVRHDLGISCLSGKLLLEDDWIEIEVIGRPPITRPLYWLTHREKAETTGVKEFLENLHPIDDCVNEHASQVHGPGMWRVGSGLNRSCDE